MKNEDLINLMYNKFVSVGERDGRIDNPEVFAGRGIQTMLVFAYDLLDEIASGAASGEKWIKTKMELIKNNG